MSPSEYRTLVLSLGSANHAAKLLHLNRATLTRRFHPSSSIPKEAELALLHLTNRGPLNKLAQAVDAAGLYDSTYTGNQEPPQKPKEQPGPPPTPTQAPQNPIKPKETHPLPTLGNQVQSLSRF